jgi:peptidyl-tRNA hydrolase, PTH1 family
MSIKLVVGLRNPGHAYENTRHNAGAWFVDAWLKKTQECCHIEKKFQTEMCSLSLPQGMCYVALPLTFMNHSGQVVRALSQFYRILPDEILVVHDELDFAVGTIKLKSGGGHGGHNGLRDIITQLGSSDFHRLRVGIGHPGHKSQVHDYVLSKPSKDDRQQVEHSIQKILGTMPLLLEGRLGEAMTSLNKR